MIDLKRTNDKIRVELAELPKEKLRTELLDILAALETAKESKTAKMEEYKELLQSGEIQLRKDEVYQEVEKVRKLGYWKKVLEREIYPDTIANEEVTEWQMKKKSSGKSSQK